MGGAKTKVWHKIPNVWVLSRQMDASDKTELPSVFFHLVSEWCLKLQEGKHLPVKNKQNKKPHSFYY